MKPADWSSDLQTNKPTVGSAALVFVGSFKIYR